MINLAEYDEIGRMAAITGLIFVAVAGGAIIRYISYRGQRDDRRRYIEWLDKVHESNKKDDPGG
jgi:hypothetical protein